VYTHYIRRGMVYEVPSDAYRRPRVHFFSRRRPLQGEASARSRARVRTIFYRRPQMHRSPTARVNHARLSARSSAEKTRSPVDPCANNSPDLVIREDPMCGRFGVFPRPFHRPLHISTAANAIACRVHTFAARGSTAAAAKQ